ncbi:MAG TPA: Bcr/CflA family efflux MFS transporter [Ideonella sp.]|uniref:Bcr/CflA family efflux MFS transporter n=1 Tax=Ideonella sp. TaxID=1929293 RepID=UPI002E32D67A|nr:Bcr/CflA family efflux MFS transporter [Ideonella sp.]HEX5684965.1 Bcr/CflA family efflux MFS transporter [Ideonella sp.]
MTAAPPPRVHPLTPALAALAIALLLGLQPVTTDLYLPALPLLAAELKAPMAAAQLTMSLVLLAFGIGQLVMGPLSDRFGRKPVLLGGLALHTLASLGAMSAPHIDALIGFRALQGLGLAASVVCARAMVRDLYEPRQGAHVMTWALTGLGVLALASPLLGGWLTAVSGWRAPLGAVAMVAVLTLVFIAWRVPETCPQRDPHALHPGPLRRSAAVVLRHPAFRAWAALVSATYGGLFLLLAGSSFVYIGVLGLSPWGYGLAMASASLSYMAATFYCRRLLVRRGLAGAVRLGAVFTLAGGLGMACLALSGSHDLAGVLLAHWLYNFGHGIHQPCGQAGAVGPFPRMAGVASALAGFLLALVAFAVGLWLGQALDGSLRPLGLGLAFFALATTTIAWTLVQRDGERFELAPT